MPSPRSSTSSELPMIERPNHSHNANGDSRQRFSDELPQKPPVISKTLSLHPAFYVLSWIFFSNCTILFNKWLIDTAGFRYPIILTCWHLIFATLATQLLARTTSLLDSRHSLPIDGRFYLRTIVPIGILYTGSLVCSNVVYLYLSVSFIQMLKSASPVAVLFFSWVWGLVKPTQSMLINIFVIVCGVGLASVGEIQFSIIGFLFQVGGIVFEAVRLVMIQVMLSSEGLKMDPLVGLYYYAPVCAVMNLAVAIPTELPTFELQHLWDAGPFMLFLNALVAFMLNVASVCLIGKTSGLVMTLTGIFKSILLVITSVIIWNTEITLLQGLGYAIALAGLVYYSLGADQASMAYNSFSTWARDSLKAWKKGDNVWSPGQRKWIILFGVLCVVSLITAVGIWKGPVALRKAADAFPSLFGSE